MSPRSMQWRSLAEMGLGPKVRLACLFSYPSEDLFGRWAVDHFVGYGNVRDGGSRICAGG